LNACLIRLMTNSMLGPSQTELKNFWELMNRALKTRGNARLATSFHR
jgi:hypothetical protein